MVTINGEVVDPILIDEAFMRIKAAAEGKSESSCCERDDEFLEQARNEVIEGILLAQEAERIIPTPEQGEIREHFEETLREWRAHGASWDLLEAQRDQLRGEIVAKLRMDRFVESVWSGLPELGENDLHAWYRDHQDEFRRPARSKVLHLVIFPDESNPADDYRKLAGIRNDILDGADFAELASAHTQKADREIDLGWIEQERILNTFESMLFSLRENEVSPVFYYEQALHLIWPVIVEPEHIAPYETVADQVREMALTDQRRRALHEFALKLKTEAVIEHEAIS
ncbi:peptidylprolyl isomerase [Haloferula sp.]|uniref:peptidylprolyl isomerase n=1 Tax=Haloferula sp. TaxID=2497595 RepID=UPI003C70DBEC